jgi:UDP-glucose-4-epimerase GalE
LHKQEKLGVRVSILVTGGAGYIGSHTAKALSAAGFCPIVLDDLSRGHASAVKWGPFISADIADSLQVRRIIEKHDVKAVLHFAASAYVSESMTAPRKYFLNNVRNTLGFLEGVADSGVNQIVFSSTCATYGIPEGVSIAEEHPQRPVNPYGDSKLFVERVLHWYAQAYGLRFVTLRYFNAAGADPQGEIGEQHDPETHLIPRVIQAALGRLPEIEIFGNDYDTPDGTAVRDYVHVSDLADAHVLALQHLLRGGPNCALNLGTGRGHSVREVIDAVEKVSGRKVQTRILPRRQGDPPVLVARSSRAREILNWSPRRSSLETIVRTALRWQKFLMLPRVLRKPTGARASGGQAAAGTI